MLIVHEETPHRPDRRACACDMVSKVWSAEMRIYMIGVYHLFQSLQTSKNREIQVFRGVLINSTVEQTRDWIQLHRSIVSYRLEGSVFLA